MSGEVGREGFSEKVTFQLREIMERANPTVSQAGERVDCECKGLVVGLSLAC